MLGISPFTVCHGLIPRIPIAGQVAAPVGAFAYDEENTPELYAEELIEYMKWSCKQIVLKLKAADEKSKREYDSKHEFAGSFT